MHGFHLVKAYSRTQSNIALSSRDAEYYALVSTVSEALGLVAMTEDFGDKAEAYLYADAGAAIGVANREGLGRSVISIPSRSGCSKRFESADLGWARCLAPRILRISRRSMWTQSCWASTHIAWAASSWRAAQI